MPRPADHRSRRVSAAYAAAFLSSPAGSLDPARRLGERHGDEPQNRGEVGDGSQGGDDSEKCGRTGEAPVESGPDPVITGVAAVSGVVYAGSAWPYRGACAHTIGCVAPAG